MHYGHSGFSKNGGYTIVPKNNAFINVIGQRGGLSDGDIRRINSKYNCKVQKSYGHAFNNFEAHTSSPFKYTPSPIFEHKRSEPSFKSKKKFNVDDDDIDNLFNI